MGALEEKQEMTTSTSRYVFWKIEKEANSFILVTLSSDYSFLAVQIASITHIKKATNFRIAFS